MDTLMDIMERLRGPKGCPWDREQTHRSLKPYVIEEAYEVLEAIDLALDEGDDDALIEELGDLLLQVVFHTQIARETNRFDLNDVIQTLRDKLIRRHPHVFSRPADTDTETVVRDWETIKKRERKKSRRSSDDESLLHGIPKGLPALTLAKEMQQRTARVGFEWENVHGALNKIAEEASEISAILDEQDESTNAANVNERLEHEWGDLFFSLVNAARYCRVDPETALFKATRRFKRRFEHIEREARRQNASPAEMALDDMDALWEEAKKTEEECT